MAEDKLKIMHLVSAKIIICILLSCAGCANQQINWQKAKSSQTDFAIDNRECIEIAKQLARAESENGKSIIAETFELKKIECLVSKGWQAKKAATKEKKIKLQPPNTELNQNTLSGFGLTINLPPEVQLKQHYKSNSGPTEIDKYFFKVAGDSYLNIIFQNSPNNKLLSHPYPVKKPFTEYTYGYGAKAGIKLRWTIFAGKTGNDWVMGLGSYYLTNNHQRIIIVATAPFSPPSEPIPTGLSFSKNQQQEINNFIQQWVPWLNNQFPSEQTPAKRANNFIKRLSRKLVISF